MKERKAYKITKPRKVNFHNPDDFTVVVLGMAGLSTKCIVRETGLTMCQVGYRLNKARVKRIDYRNGNNPVAQLILARTNEAIEKRIRSGLKEKGLIGF